MIRFCDVGYAYEEEIALKNINFRVREGTCAFLSGPNGAGKSTLFKIINGLCFPNCGKYFFQGREITAAALNDKKYAKGFHQKIGYIWQNPEAQLFCGSVEEEIAFGPRQMGLSEEDTAKRVEDALELFNLKRLRHRAPYCLSGGEKKKTAIAAIFVMNPELWTLDEPLNSLDAKTQEWLINFLAQLKEAGKTIVFSSHYAASAKILADMELKLTENHEMQVIAKT